MKIHSYLSPKCEIRTSKLDNLGVFAKEEIKKDEIVTIWGGVIYSLDEIEVISKKFPHFKTHPFGVYENFYMGPLSPNDELDDAERFNHACDANAGIKGQIILVAKRSIKAGEEICFDYETVEITEDELGFECKCQSKNCRNLITGAAWKDENFVKDNWEYLSWFVQEKIKKQNRHQ